MDRRPVPPSRRRAYEASIRLIDESIYAGSAIAGVFALLATPRAVELELVGWEWVIPVWGALLVLGGIGGLIGRLTRYWIIEVPSLPLVAMGIGIYFIVLGARSLSSWLSMVSTMLVLVAFLVMLRRYLELQLFATEPDDADLRDRLRTALHRRTKDAVPHG